VELRRVESLVDARVGALAAAVNAERVAGFPSGRLFLDSIEQALAVALVNGYTLRHRSVQTYRGGLGFARLRRIKEFVHAKIEDDLTICEMAQSVELSTAHFSRMFRKSTGETPHQFHERAPRNLPLIVFSRNAPKPINLLVGHCLAH
jgi:AraC family transcriptional regulator